MNNKISQDPVTLHGGFYEDARCHSPEEEYNYTYLNKYGTGDNNTMIYLTNVEVHNSCISKFFNIQNLHINLTV